MNELTKKDIKTQLAEGARALREMGAVIQENLNALADTMQASEAGGFTGEATKDQEIAFACDTLGFISHKLQGSCLTLLAAWGDKYVKNTEDAQAFAKLADQRIEVVRQRLERAALGTSGN